MWNRFRTIIIVNNRKIIKSFEAEVLVISMHFKAYKINRICLVLLLDIIFTKAILVLQIPLY